MAKKRKSNSNTVLRNNDTISRAHEIVRREVDRIPGYKKYVSNHVHILCPFHDERTPSCAVHIGVDSLVPIGWYNCFGCGQSGPWNQIAEKLGLEKIQKQDQRQDRVRSHNFDSLRGELLEVKTEEETLQKYIDEFNAGMSFEIPNSFVWRGVKGTLLRKLGAKQIIDTHTNDLTVLLPVSVNGTIVGAIKARSKKEKGKTSYITSSGSWVKKNGLFPFDYTLKVLRKKKLNTLVLVEGPRDALRLLKMGVPAIAILGANSWTKEKTNMVLSVVDNVIIAMDSDSAGVNATNKIRSSFKQYIKPKIVRTKDIAKKLGVSKLDPGNMPKKEIVKHITAKLK